MLSALSWLQASALGHFMRESSAWTYAVVNLAHILGISSLFGSVLVIDLRLLGAWRQVPRSSIAATASPIATMGFVLAAASGIGMLSANGTEYVGNPFLLVKFPAIGLGLVNALAIRRSSAWRAGRTRELDSREERQLRVMGGTSLLCWLTAITAGRMIGYW
jgi:hypothetical protein